MKWIGLNALGASSWIAGLCLAIGLRPGWPFAGTTQSPGLAVALAVLGLVVMLWSNFGAGAEL